MPALALLRGLHVSKTNLTALRLYHVGRAASVDTAIAKGIRKSNGLGLRGKSKPSDNDPRKKYIERKGISAYAPAPKDDSTIQNKHTHTRQERGNVDTRIRRGKKDIKPERETRPWESGKKGTTGRRRDGGNSGSSEDRKGFPDRSSFDRLPARAEDKRPPRDFSGRATGRGGSSRNFGDENAEIRPYKSGQADRLCHSSEKYPSLEGGSRGSQNSFQSRASDRSSNSGYEKGDMPRSNVIRDSSSTQRPRSFGETPSSSEPLRDSFDSKPPSTFFNRKTGKFEPRSADGGYHSKNEPSEFIQLQSETQNAGVHEDQELSPLIRRTNKFDPRSSDGYQKPSRTREFSKPRKHSTDPNFATRTSSSYGAGEFEQRSDGNYRSNDRSPVYSRQQGNTQHEVSSPFIDRNIPLSIPYTTPASEFLYGTSVVEAALSSRRSPRRKLYKLYIYTGENRENPAQDRVIEKLARDEGVEVMKVSGEWIRLLDKMSTGRPHNGYILEASPLPRLPILSLGNTVEKDGLDGFEVKLDYQSREDAAVNGTGTFIKKPFSKSQRNPLVLYLDSITDPGNLGGIIRTAAFLGVTAVAISTRNSAPFTPVVLKASAGASENVTIFSVNKPAGFIVDSKAAGWKVYAAVAPSGKKDPGMPAAISTDLLEDPLAEHPCILMLGSEGEGLRWNLRSKADSDLFIRGSGQSYNVDSLNVSVATGLLVNAFLSKRGKFITKKEVAAEASEISEIEASDFYPSDMNDESSGDMEAENSSPPEKLGENALF